MPKTTVCEIVTLTVLKYLAPVLFIPQLLFGKNTEIIENFEINRRTESAVALC